MNRNTYHYREAGNDKKKVMAI